MSPNESNTVTQYILWPERAERTVNWGPKLHCTRFQGPHHGPSRSQSSCDMKWLCELRPFWSSGFLFYYSYLIFFVYLTISYHLPGVFQKAVLMFNLNRRSHLVVFLHTFGQPMIPGNIWPLKEHLIKRRFVCTHHHPHHVSILSRRVVKASSHMGWRTLALKYQKGIGSWWSEVKHNMRLPETTIGPICSCSIHKLPSFLLHSKGTESAVVTWSSWGTFLQQCYGTHARSHMFSLQTHDMKRTCM